MPKYIKKTLKEAIQNSFGDVELILFGSRIDDNKKGGDFDLAIKGNLLKKDFKKAKVEFWKYLLKRDLDLPIDLVHYNFANTLLKSEIDKGQKI